ncbi:1549_t:CDS:2 [Scutellospora calospora]|uniref:1549_t:CDS:1 n=1 Tax=Scutellospora calospora TaxID=85575 RepID=A0ACA9JUI1_9GLOM|nr:1549_t:CDS:2 [Scutellospora calospora]
MAISKIIIKIANVLALFFLLGVNIYSGLGPDNESHYTKNHITYISPAYFTFYVWFLIHLLLIGFVIYQFFLEAPRDEAITKDIHWHFVGVALLNTLWLALWNDDLLLLSWITIFVVVCQVTYIYHALYNRYTFESPPPSWLENLFIKFPFTLYHAWIVVVAVLTTYAVITPEKTYQTANTTNTTNATSTTTTYGSEEPNIIVQIAVIIGLIILESTVITYIELREDWAGGAVIAWTLYGIWYEQEDPVIHWTALVLAVTATIYLFKPLVVKYIKDKEPF